MRRRDLIAMLGGAVMAWPHLAPAQEAGRTYRISFLVPFPRSSPFLAPYFDELSRNGFVEGRNLFVDPRGFGVPVANFDTVAAALAKSGLDAIVPLGPQADRAVQQATKTIPIVAGMDDPIASKLVASLAHPGGNMTGVGLFASQLDSKRLEVLHETIPEARRIGILADPAQTSSWPQLRQAAGSLGVELTFFYARSGAEIVAAVDAMAGAQMGAANILASPVLGGAAPLTVENMRRVRLPAMFQWPETVRDGGLVAYGPSNDAVDRLNTQQLIRVLKGEKPADIPVEQPTRFELAINLKTAKALGLAIAPTLLARADEVIE
jgi:putative tryptophan/tyrosine transport system substrate-binding protein